MDITGQREFPRKLSILDFALILVERKRFLLVSMTLVSIGAVILTLFVLRVKYSATAVVMPPRQTYSSPLGSLLSGMPFDGLLQQSFGMLNGDAGETYLSILGSRRLAEKVIEKFNLVDRYGFRKKRKYYFEDVLKKFNKNVDASQGDLGTISISVRDTSPEACAAMANFIVEQLDDVNYQITRSRAHFQRTFFENRLSDIRRDLDSVHVRFAKFKTEHSYLDLETQLSATIQTIAELEASAMMVDMEMEVLRGKFGSDNPKITEMRERERAMQRKIAQYMEKGNGDIIIALKKSPELGIEYAYLMRDVKIQEALYQFVLQMYEQAKFEEINDTPVVEVLEKAQVPQKKSQPKRSLICILIFFAGLVVNCTYVVAQKWFAVQSAHDTETARKIIQVVRNLKAWK